MEQPNFPYYNTVDQIYHAAWSTNKLARLELIRESIHKLWPNGHPTRMIHVAGTGGKGSTCRFLEVGLGCLGRAGAFMSPHLFDYRERFSINGEFALHDDITEAWEQRIRPHCLQLALHNEAHAHTVPEVSILMALALFDKHNIEWAAIEASVGGRYDQTRALDVEATVLTNVGSDHAHMLGKEFWQRVLDKAGIARPGVPFFTSETNPAALEIIAGVCANVNAPLYMIGQSDISEFERALTGHKDEDIAADSLLSAGYQRWNATLSHHVIRHLHPRVQQDQLLDAFTKAKLIGRFWKVEERVYADIAHNAEKVRVLAEEIDKRFGEMGKILVMGLSGRRVPHEVFAELAHIAKTIIITGASYKLQDPAKVRREIESLTGDTPTLVITEPRQAFQIAKSMQAAEDVVILTGSAYMIEQVLNPDPYLRYLNKSYGWRTETNTEATGTIQLTLP